MNRLPRPRAGACLALALAVIGPGLARAQGQAPPQPIKFEIQVAHSRRPPGEIDPACAGIQKRLPFRFGSLRCVQLQRLSLAFGQSGQMKLPNGRAVKLLPITVVQGQLHLQFDMRGVVNTRLRMRNRQPMILGGEAYQDGHLIIMVTPDFGAHLKQKPARGPELYPAGHPGAPKPKIDAKGRSAYAPEQ